MENGMERLELESKFIWKLHVKWNWKVYETKTGTKLEINWTKAHLQLLA